MTTLRQSNPTGSYNLITANVSLVAEVDKVVDAVKEQKTKLDMLFVSAGFVPFEGRMLTREGLEPSMSTRYCSRLRAIQQLLPLLNNALSPRIVSVLAGGIEAAINEDDLDLRKNPKHWSFWNASVYSATMGTLAFEMIGQKTPNLSIVHWFPGPVATPGFARSREFGFASTYAMSQDEGGARAVFLTTSDRYSVQGGLIPVPDGLEPVKRSTGGVFLVGPEGEGTDNEDVLADMRNRGLPQKVWNFTQDIFEDCTAQTRPKDEL